MQVKCWCSHLCCQNKKNLKILLELPDLDHPNHQNLCQFFLFKSSLPQCILTCGQHSFHFIEAAFHDSPNSFPFLFLFNVLSLLFEVLRNHRFLQQVMKFLFLSLFFTNFKFFHFILHLMSLKAQFLSFYYFSFHKILIFLELRTNHAVFYPIVYPSL